MHFSDLSQENLYKAARADYLQKHPGLQEQYDLHAEDKKILAKNPLPTIKVNGAAVEQHWSQDKFTDKGVTTSDDCDKNLPKYTTWWSGASGSFDQKQLGKHYLNYKVCDHVGRCSTTKRTIVVEDNKKPKLNLVGDSKMTLQAKHGAKYNDRGAQCQDFVDGNLRHAITNVIALNGKQRLYFSQKPQCWLRVHTEVSQMVAEPPHALFVSKVG